MSTPEWLADAIFYQIFPERFSSGDPSLTPADADPWDAAPTPDNFLGGDLQGIVNHLDHLTDLGVNTLYLTPIFEAHTNHRYDAIDYFTIDHRLGTPETFRRFIDTCHDRGLRVVLDAVLNHCGYGHWAFQDVIANEADSPYINWFFTETFPIHAAPEPNYRTCSGCWYLPKWNTYNPQVRAHHFEVAKYWLSQGIDGWRLDVPYFVPRSFWRQFRNVVKSCSEDAYIVAEEWRWPERWLSGDTADGAMNYTLRDLVLRFTADRTINAFQFADGMNKLTTSVAPERRSGMLNLLGSHDTERLLTRHRGDEAATRLAYTLLLTSEGAPMIYYGDEVGMLGDNDPGCRAGMQWDRRRWSEAIHSHVRELTGRRRTSIALRKGIQQVVPIDTDTVVLERDSHHERAAAIVHRGTGTSIDVHQHPVLAKYRPGGSGHITLAPNSSTLVASS